MFEAVTDLMAGGGYVAIAALMFAENVFPPIPSELIMPLAGFAAARGDLSLVLVVLAGSIGSLAGAAFWYWVGAWVGRVRVRRWAGRHGRWLTLTPDDVDRASDWFHRRGGRAVFTGRLVPVVRTLVSLPAGTGAMPITRFLAFSALGTALWTGLLALAGYLLESQYARVSDYLDPVSKIVIVVIVVYYLWRVWNFPGPPRGPKSPEYPDESQGGAGE